MANPTLPPQKQFSSSRVVLGAIVCLELREPNRDRLVEIVAYGESDPSRGRFAYNKPVAQFTGVKLLQACPAEAEADAWSQ